MKKTVIRSKTVWRVITTQLRAQYILLALGLGALLLLPAIFVLLAAGNEWYMKSLAGMLGFLKGETVFCGLLPMMFFALLLAVLQFSYLFHRARVDGVHSLPVTRVELFLGRVGAAVLAMAAGAVLFAASALSALLFAVPQFFPDTWDVVLSNAGMIFTGGLAVYFFTALCAAFTGSLWEMILSAALLGLGGTVANVCLGWIVRASVPISVYPVNGGIFSPYILPWETIVNREMRDLLVLALWIVLSFAAGFWGFCRRRSELGEGGFATGFQKLVRAVTALDAALVMGILALYMFRSSYAMYVLCGAAAAIVSGIVLHLLYTHSPKGMWTAVRWSAAGLCAAAVLNLCVAVGWIGVPRLPGADTVRAVTLSMGRERYVRDETEGSYRTESLENIYPGFWRCSLRFPDMENDGENCFLNAGSVAEGDVQAGMALAQGMLAMQRETFFPYLPRRMDPFLFGTREAGWETEERFRMTVSLYTDTGELSFAYDGLFEENMQALVDGAKALAASPDYESDPYTFAALHAVEAVTPDTYALSDFGDGAAPVRIPREEREALGERLCAAYARDEQGLPAANGETARPGKGEEMYVLQISSDTPVTLSGGFCQVYDGESDTYAYLPAKGMRVFLGDVAPETVYAEDGTVIGSRPPDVPQISVAETDPNLFDALRELCESRGAAE